MQATNESCWLIIFTEYDVRRAATSKSPTSSESKRKRRSHQEPFDPWTSSSKLYLCSVKVDELSTLANHMNQTLSAVLNSNSPGCTSLRKFLTNDPKSQRRERSGWTTRHCCRASFFLPHGRKEIDDGNKLWHWTRPRPPFFFSRTSITDALLRSYLVSSERLHEGYGCKTLHTLKGPAGRQTHGFDVLDSWITPKLPWAWRE